MKNNGAIAEICSLPEQLEQKKNKSFSQLLTEFNVSGKNLTITVEDIKNYLKNNIGLVESWLLYSMNKRTGEGWYFKKDNKKTYVVGYLFKEVTRKKELRYSDSIQACAVFIHSELFETAPR